MRRTTAWTAAVLAVVMLCDRGEIAARDAAEAPESSPVLGRFLEEAQASPSSYRAVRRLTASNGRLGVSGWLEATVEFNAEDGLRYEIVAEGGSGHIRNKVLRRILAREVDERNAGGTSRAALTLENYEFGEAERTSGDEVRIAIAPRRRGELLVKGAIVLASSDADLLRVEGRLTKTPSFWTRRVDIVHRYGRVRGFRLPLATSSTAHVPMVGVSSFTMCYDYEVVDGVAVVPRISCS